MFLHATRAILVAIVILLAIPVDGEDLAYTASFSVYRIHDTPIDFLRPDEVNDKLNVNLERMLDSPITIAFENVHISEIFKFIREIYELDIEIDVGAVAPPHTASAGHVSDGMVQYINLKSVSVRDALEAILAPLKLDYTVDGSKVRVRKASGSSPSDSARQRMTRRYSPSPQLTVMTQGAVRVGSALVTLSDGRRDALGTESNVTFLAGPSIHLLPNQQAQLTMNSPVQWLAPIPGSDGDYRLQHTASKTGATVDLLVKEASNDQIECTLSMSVDSIRQRRPVPGTGLDIGEPIFDTAKAAVYAILKLGQPTALLTQLGENSDDVLLVLFNIDKQMPTVAENATALPRYSLGTRLIQVRGEPDWQWWMQPYARASRIYEGGGRVLGPVVVPRMDKRPKTFDWKRLGFSKVTLSNPLNNDPGGMVHVVDSQFAPGAKKKFPYTFHTGTDQPNTAPIDLSHPAFEAYRQVAPDGPPLKPEELRGKILSLALKTRYVLLAIGEAFPTSTPSLYRIDQKILLNHPRIDTEDPLLRRTFEFSCESDGNAMLAFLLPIADDEYWIILTDFSLEKDESLDDKKP